MIKSTTNIQADMADNKMVAIKITTFLFSTTIFVHPRGRDKRSQS